VYLSAADLARGIDADAKIVGKLLTHHCDSIRGIDVEPWSDDTYKIEIRDE
jgi:hypothetical protein